VRPTREGGEHHAARRSSKKADATMGNPSATIDEGIRDIMPLGEPHSGVRSVYYLVKFSYVERQNLTLRMQLRRVTRLTNGFSKKLSHLKAAVALHFAYYNFCRIHSSIRDGSLDHRPYMDVGRTANLGVIFR
jgi:hypothetical protein